MALDGTRGFGDVRMLASFAAGSPDIELRTTPFHGRKIGLEVKDCLSKMGQTALTVFSLIKHNTFELGRSLKLTLRTIKAFQPGALAAASGEMRKVLTWFDSIFFLMDTDYFLNKRYENDIKEKPLVFAGICNFAIANLASAALFFEEVGIVKLGTLSSSLGSVSIFGAAVSLSLGTLIRTTVGAAFALFAVDALRRIAKETDRTQAVLDLMKWGLELTAFTVGIFTGASIGTVALIGACGSAMGLVSFLHRERAHLNKIWEPAPGAQAIA